MALNGRTALLRALPGSGHAEGGRPPTAGGRPPSLSLRRAVHGLPLSAAGAVRRPAGAPFGPYLPLAASLSLEPAETLTL
ncbi:hypothetical protein B9W68_09985 [Streptomyces sp. CS227]|nr:hypothetical protein B9W68_09985 [Streptomyces sp. CS227]